MIAVDRHLVKIGWNALARLGAQAWAKLLSLVLSALILRFAGAAALGHYLMALTTVGLTLAFSDLGLSVLLTREGAKVESLRQHRRLLGDILGLKAVLAGAGTLLVVALAPVLPLSAETRRLIPIGALMLVPDALTAGVHASLNARRQMDTSSLITGIARFAAAAGILGSLLSGGSVARLIGWQVFASLLGAGISFWILWQQGAWPEFGLVDLSRGRRWLAYLRESLPFTLTGAISMLYRRLDLLLLGSWSGELVAGWYGAAARLWEAVHLLPSSLLDAFFPEMSRWAKQDAGRRRLHRLLLPVGVGMLVVGSGLALAGAVGGRTALRLIYGAELAPATIKTWHVLVGAVPAVFLYLLGGHTLYAVGAQGVVTVRMVIVAVVNTALNVLLIGRWRHLGAATALLVSEWLLCLLLFPKAWRMTGDGDA